MTSKLTSGFVIKPLKVASTNAVDTATPNNGVVRDVKPIPTSFDLGVGGSVLDVAGDQYRVAFLEGPNQEPSEYLVWAANNSNLALVEDDSWSTTNGVGKIPSGTAIVLDSSPPDGGQRTDGSTRLVVTDNGGRSLAKILSVKVIRGDDSLRVEHTLSYPTDFSVPDADSGLLYLVDNATTQAALTPATGEHPAFSALRRDTITEVEYVIAQARFWWTRNDVYQTRFSWNGRTQRWEPLRGGSPSNLGVLLPLETYALQPSPEGLTEGVYLPGSLDFDSYSMLRVGSSPNAQSIPIAPNPSGPFEGVLVVTDESASTVFDFSSYTPPPAAVVGVTSGLLQWNQNFVAQNAGLSIWYVPQTFDPESKGRLGLLLDAKSTPLHIAPVPGLSENPHLRLGSRKYLTVIPVATEAEQDALPSVLEGTVSVTGSTGRLRFSLEDIAKADPDDSGFDIRYLNVEVFYDGVSLNRKAQPVRSPTAAIGTGGEEEVVADSNLLYLRNAEPLPGLGTSGILHVPDGTGSIPIPGNAHLRPGGDSSLEDDYSGLLRWVEGVGDSILFTRSGSLVEIRVVDTSADFPSFRFHIPQGTGYIARKLEKSGNFDRGSLVELGVTDRQRFSGELLYFLQAELLPAQYTEQARVFSRVRHTFTLDGTESLHFAIDGGTVVKTVAPSGAGTYTAAQIAAHLNSGLSAGRAYELSGHVVLEAEDPTSGTIEIGFGSSTRDLSGAAALGLLPGWRVDTTDPATFWLPDSGVSVGLFRSPSNLDRAEGVPDAQARVRFEEKLLVPSTQAQPFVFLTNPPLRDVAGFDEDVFFKVVSGDGARLLRNFSEVEYRFTEDNPKYAWLEGHTEQAAITRPVTTLNFQRTNISSPTLLGVVGGGLYSSEDGGPLQRQALGTDYLLDAGGSTGGATLITQVGRKISSGARGSFTAGEATFTDLTATFQTDSIAPGYRLKLLSGDATGQSFIVQEVLSETRLVVAVPSFPVGSGGIPVAWELCEGFSANVYDPSLLADVVYEEFNHLQEEPFRVRLLSSVGEIPSTDSEQIANRNVAFVADAIERGRSMAVRFGLENRVSEVSLTLLQYPELGLLAKGLLIPDALSDDHFLNQTFRVRVGSTQFTQGVDLFPVTSFTVPAPATGTVEYLTSTGELAFATDILTDYQSAIVRYEQEFLPAAQVPVGTAELNSLTGELNFAAFELMAYHQRTGYFVEQMVTERRVDVAMNPLAGSFVFFQPLREGQIVEAHYFVADNQGGKALDEDGNAIEVLEFLPLYIRSEEASRVTPQAYTFNSNGKTADDRIAPAVYVDVNRQNYGSKTTAEVVFDPEPYIYFQGFTVDASSVVKISYAVLEAFGGETGYSTSQRPVYRPPFFLGKRQTTFTLEGDRSAELTPGKVLRLGARPLYIQSSVWDSVQDSTTVTIYPELEQEVGIRAPGNDVLSLLTSVPVTTLVNGVSTSAAAGFLLTVTAPYAPVRKGTREIRFEGDLTQFAVAGHLIEVGGVPFLVINASQSEDGATTSVEVSVAFPREFHFGSDAVKLSVRPVYPDGALQFLGRSPLLRSEPFELVLFGERDRSGDLLPGRTLELGVEYDIDAESGNVTLIEGNQAGIRTGQRFFLRYTKLKSLQPRLGSGYVILPRFRADFHHVTVPSEDNQFLATSVLGTFTFHNPDSFFFRVDTMDNFISEVQQDRVNLLASQNPSGGPIITVASPVENQDRGFSGFGSQRRSLLDSDRAGRTLLDFYNSTVSCLEQVQETYNGLLVGDRDGKFQHFVGRGARFAPPGFEDEITGYLNPRYLWTEVFLSETSTQAVPIRALPKDPLVDPATATLVSAELLGNLPLPNVLEQLLASQEVLLRNAVDDLLLTQRGVVTAVLSGFPPVRMYQASGVFKSMAEPQQFSRLFPTTTLAFTTTVPGLGADPANGNLGVYAFRRTLLNAGGDAETQSTYQQSMATLSNPVQGVLTNIVDVAISDRLPRARVVSFSSTGYPEVDLFSSGLPAALLSVVPLSEFPVDTSTGLPDTGRLLSQALTSGAVFDIATGNPDLHTPPFETGQPLALGRSNGEVVVLRYVREKVDIQGNAVFGGVYVKDVLSGCIVTFQGKSGNILNAADIVTVDASGLPLPVEMGPGDSLFVVTDSATNIAPSDPPTQADIERLAASLASYRIGVDLGVNKQTGEVLDITQSSFADPSNLALKELLGQHPPVPGTSIEALLTFSNGSVKHTQFPALDSQARNDSGDESLPYKVCLETEQVLLRKAAQALRELRYDSPVPSAVYPDEILGTDGQVYLSHSLGFPPATLVTVEDALPVTTAGSYTAHSGMGDVRQYDLLLVQVDDTASSINQGSQGILSVGDVSRAGGHSFLEPPRFITQTRKGDRIRYKLNNAMTHFTSSLGTSGVTVQESGGNTSLLFSDVGFYLDDGEGTSQGGLNHILDNALLPFPNENSITVRLYDQSTGSLLQTLVFSGRIAAPASSATGGLGTVYNAAPISIGGGAIVYPGVSFVDFTALGGASPGPVGPFDVTISIDTYTAGLSGDRINTGSSTAYISSDRLTFLESVDLSTARDRWFGFPTGLEVLTVTSPDSEDMTVNSPFWVNGNLPFTFLERTPGSVGSFQAATSGGAGDESGAIKVMAWEGFYNTPILSTGPVQFSAIPSSSQDTSGVICQGTGGCNGSSSQYDFRVTDIEVLSGSLPRVYKGDVLVIDTAADPSPASFPGALATTKAGAYLIRQVVESNDTVLHPDRREVTLTANAGDGFGWLDVRFPRVVTYDDVLKSLTVTSITLVEGSPTMHAFPVTGRVYVLTANFAEIANATDYTAYKSAVVSAQYASVSQPTNQFLGLTDFRDAGGVVIASSVFAAAATVGRQISGMTYFQAQVGGEQGLPSLNVVGRDTSDSIFGVRHFSVQGDLVPSSPAAALFYDGSLGEIGKVSGAGVCIVVTQRAVSPSTSFVSDADASVYPAIPGVVDITSILPADWASLHQPVAHPNSLVSCVLPGESFVTESNLSDPGFWAQAAIFLEPSWPTPTQNLLLSAQLVDANHSLALSRIGMQDVNNFIPSPISQERVRFEVRRIRRFGAGVQSILEALQDLQFTYAVRRGDIVSYSSTRQMGIVETDGGTQLGLLTDTRVNINPGDSFRLLDALGNVVEEVPILGVRNGVELLLSPPGLTVPLLGNRFEVYLRQPLVPHEQSHAQLLELATDSWVHETTANVGTGAGGFVTDTGVLKDTGVSGTGLETFTALGVQEGDYVLVDASGELNPTGAPTVRERGVSPLGDRGVSTRVDGSYVAGRPSELDDNRGFYRVVAVNADNLVLSGASKFAGDLSSGDVIFESGGWELALYPTIHDSLLLPGGIEGQNDLRKTALAGEIGSPAGSYLGNAYSIAPFSYRVLRPIGLLTTETVELLLMLRERFLSWREMLDQWVMEGGTFFIFQRDSQAEDLRQGLLNVSVTSGLEGQVGVAPFANDADALSVLDRRFWVLDSQLDYTAPPFTGGDAYTSFRTGRGRPVFPDDIEMALGNRDNLRDFRSVWLDYRVNLISGTLSAIRRYDAQEPQREANQRDLIRFRGGAG